MGLHYATQLYRPPRPEVWDRLLQGILSNLELKAVDSATVYIDGCEPPWQHPKLTWVRRQGRASFADFLELAAMPGESESARHLLFANSDIVFDEQIGELAAAVSRPDWVICLTRRERDGSYPAGIPPMQSQDAWLLCTQPLPPLLLAQIRGIRLGVGGCEHLFAAAMVAHGFKLWNPCEDLVALHSDPDPLSYEPGGERYWGLYAYVPPCTLDDVGRHDRGIVFAFAQAPGRYYGAEIG